MTKDEALKLALEALETSMYPQQKQLQAITAIKEALMSVPDGAQPEQEPVGDALYFAQWTADKKDLSDYVLVGSLSLAGIEDGEYGQSEIDSFENAIEALQEKLVTGADHKKVPLLAYIGALNSTSPQPAQREPAWRTDGGIPRFKPAQRTWVEMSDERIKGIFSYHGQFASGKDLPMLRVIEAMLKENASPQRTWVGLTDEEITDIWAEASPYYHEDDFARAIEAKLREKNQ